MISRSLRGETFVSDLCSALVPHGRFESGVMRDDIGVILAGIAKGDGVESFAKKFLEKATASLLVPWIGELSRDSVNDGELVVEFPQQENACVGSDGLTFAPHFDATVEIKGKRINQVHIKFGRLQFIILTPLMD